MKTFLLTSFGNVVLYILNVEVRGLLAYSCPAVDIAPCTCLPVMPFTTSLRSQKNSLEELIIMSSSVDVFNLDALDGAGIFFSIAFFESSLNTLKGDPFLPHLGSFAVFNSSLRYLPVLTKARSLSGFFLYGSSVYSLAPNMFANFLALNHLELSNNKLVALQDNWLNVNSHNLTRLILADNKLSHVAPGAITGITSSTNISLANNQLTTLSEDAFRPLLGLAQKGNIDVSGTTNRKAYYYFNNTTAVFDVYISLGNKLNCDCSMAWLFRDPELMDKVIAECYVEGTSGGSYIPLTSIDVSKFDDC